MDAYKALAESYDRLTNDVDYAATVDFYEQILAREGLRPRTCVDLACGTGSVTEILARKGYEVTGVDMSEEMLTVAASKVMDLDGFPCSPASVWSSCGCPEPWTWRCAPWTAWTIFSTLRTAQRPSGGRIRF